MAPPCVVDASVLLNLGMARALHVLTESARYAWKVTPIVRAETRHADTWLAALEDRKAQRVLDEVAGPGKWINCANVLLDGVEDRRLVIDEADELFRRLSCYAGYEQRGVTSLRQLVRR